MGVKSFRKASDPQCQTAEKTSMISEVAEGQGAKGNRGIETLRHLRSLDGSWRWEREGAEMMQQRRQGVEHLQCSGVKHGLVGLSASLQSCGLQ